MRHFLSLACLAAVTLVGCSAKPHLSLQDKAMVTAELIDARPACAVYLKQLSASTADEKSILETYVAAKTAYCLKPDV